VEGILMPAKPIGWTVSHSEGKCLLAASLSDTPAWIPIRDATLGLSGEGNVVHFECEANAVDAAKRAGGNVLGLYASLEPERSLEQRMVLVDFGLRLAADALPRDRMVPRFEMLEWTPIASGRHPESDDHLVYWNPCDGCYFGYWDESDGFMYGHPFTRTRANGRPGFEEATPINGGETHYAVLRGPEPRHDISVNWKLYRGDYKPPSGAPMTEWPSQYICAGCDSALRCKPSKVFDVHWFCTNEACPNHAGVDVGDQEEPAWAKEPSTST
jgi:hypothetical protein